MPRPDMTDPHERVIHDLDGTHAEALRPIIAQLRDRSRRRHIHHLGWDDPVIDALRHVAAALVALRQASAQHVPGSRLFYEALLAVAGGMTRRFRHSIPAHINLPEQRTGTR